MFTDRIPSNGICGITGKSPLPMCSLDEIAKSARSFLPPMIPRSARAVTAGVDPRALESAGWGLVLHESIPSNTLAALRPLIHHRQEQTGDRFRILQIRAGENRRSFLARHGAGPGPVDPDRIPYYLLILGDPETVPYGFHFDLGMQYAVGRIAFDEPAEYARYAESVVAYEKRPVVSSPRAVLFGVENHDDHATRQSVSHLVEPLAERLRDALPRATIDTVLRGDARKATLLQLLGGSATPDLLFTAGHALLFPPGHERQAEEQGALLCADWPGPERWLGAIPPQHSVTASDIPSRARLTGLITFLFACFSIGTPELDRFAPPSEESKPPLAPHPFLARLPQRLLSHRDGGALAVIGHVDRAWMSSFLWKDTIEQVQVFDTAFQRLLNGDPIGYSMECFGQRAAEIAAWLHGLMFEESLDGNDPTHEHDLAKLWTAYHDARNYMIFGDPAVRLSFAGDPS